MQYSRPLNLQNALCSDLKVHETVLLECVSIDKINVPGVKYTLILSIIPIVSDWHLVKNDS